MSITKEGKTSRVKLANLLVKAGYNEYKVLAAIRFPHCTGFNWQTGSREGAEHVDGSKPDDDFKLSYIKSENNSVRGDPVTFPAADKKRIATAYTKASYKLNEVASPPHRNGKMNSRKLLFIGRTLIKVETFDGWASQWRSLPWSIEFTYSDNSTKSLSGGKYKVGNSDNVTYPLAEDYWETGPHLDNYYDNGDCVIPPANEWPMPEFLKTFR